MIQSALNELIYLVQTSYLHKQNSSGDWEKQFQIGIFLDRLFQYIKNIVTNQKNILVIPIAKSKIYSSNKKPKIIHLIGKIGGIGGSQKIIFDLISYLSHKYQMEVVTLSDFMLYSYPTLSVKYIATGSELAKYLSKEEPDIIHLHYYGDWYGFHSALKIILSVPNHIKIIENINTSIQAYRHSRINQYVYVSNFVKNLQDIKTGQTIYPGVNTTEYKPSYYKNYYSKTVGFVYRLFIDKLDSSSIDTLIKIAQSDPEIRIMVVGYGQSFSKYYFQISRSGKRNQFQFCGRVDYAQLPSFYRQFSVFVAPIVKESYGLVVPYAMSMNIPIVAMNIGALPEILGSTNFLCTNQEEFIKTTLWVLNNSSKAYMHSCLGRKRILDKFSLEIMLTQYDNIYQKLLSRK